MSLDISQNNSEIDIESIPVPAPATNRKTAAYTGHSIGHRPSSMGNGFYRRSNLDNAHALKAKQKASKTKFRVMSILKFPKNKITSIDMSQFNSINSTVKRICGISGSSGVKNSKDQLFHKKSIIDEKKLKTNRLQHAYPLHSVECKMRKGINHFNTEMAASNGDNSLARIGRIVNDSSSFDNTRRFGSGYIRDMNDDTIGLHSSDCELVLSRNSDPQQCQRNECFGTIDNSIKYCSLMYNKGLKNRSGMLISSEFSLDDSEFDFNDRDQVNGMNTNLLSHGHLDTMRMPWKHRRCPSIVSSSSVASSTKWNPSKHWLAVTSILLIAGAAGVAVPLALRVSSGEFISTAT